jgi:hypothetical protein
MTSTLIFFKFNENGTIAETINEDIYKSKSTQDKIPFVPISGMVDQKGEVELSLPETYQLKKGQMAALKSFYLGMQKQASESSSSISSSSSRIIVIKKGKGEEEKMTNWLEILDNDESDPAMLSMIGLDFALSNREVSKSEALLTMKKKPEYARRFKLITSIVSTGANLDRIQTAVKKCMNLMPSKKSDFQILLEFFENEMVPTGVRNEKKGNLKEKLTTARWCSAFPELCFYFRIKMSKTLDDIFSASFSLQMDSIDKLKTEALNANRTRWVERIGGKFDENTVKARSFKDKASALVITELIPVSDVWVKEKGNAFIMKTGLSINIVTLTEMIYLVSDKFSDLFLELKKKFPEDKDAMEAVKIQLDSRNGRI